MAAMNQAHDKNAVIPERICPTCGKNFVVAVYHRFHVGDTYYCGWNCYNHRNNGVTESKDGRSTDKKPVLAFTLDGHYIREFPTAKDAGEFMGCCMTNIAHACRTGVPACGYHWEYKEMIPIVRCKNCIRKNTPDCPLCDVESITHPYDPDFYCAFGTWE